MSFADFIYGSTGAGSGAAAGAAGPAASAAGTSFADAIYGAAGAGAGAAAEGAGAAATTGGIMSAVSAAAPWVLRALAFPVNHPFISMGAAMLLSMLASHTGGQKQPTDGMMPGQAPQQPDSEGLAQLLAAAGGQRGNTIADMKKAYLMQQLMQLQGRAMENETQGQGMKPGDAIAYLP